MITSGETGIDTSSDAAVTVLANASGVPAVEVTVVNDSGVAGFVTLDGGDNYERWPADLKARTWDFRHSPIAPVVMFKRTPSGANATGLYASAF